jgi:phospholipase C
MPPGLDQLEHIVVLMMENRSFDHMLGSLPGVNGLTGTEFNPDTANPPAQVVVQPNAQYQAQLQPDPGHHFPDVALQLFGTDDGTVTQANMQGFIKSYFQQQQDIGHSHNIMSYFRPDKVPVLTGLAQSYATITTWYSSLPGPTLPNRAYAHFGTSFGNVDMTVFYLGKPIQSIYERVTDANGSAKIYYFDDASGSLGMAFLLKNQPRLFGTLDDFYQACQSGNLPQYSFLEPNYTDHDDDDGAVIASDQHPDHNVLEGEKLIFKVYDAVRRSPKWPNTLLLIVYDEHGGIYDHVVPPGVYGDQVVGPPVAQDDTPNTDTGFKFDRLGVRVPAVAVSPWIPQNTIVNDRIFDHASIPATVAKCFMPNPDAVPRSSREKAANTFEYLLSLPQARNDPPKTLHLGKVNVFAAADPNTINLDATPAGAHDPDRKMHAMLWEHVQGMKAAEELLPPEQQTGTDIAKLTTEADAAGYIKQVMQKLRGDAAAAAQGRK